MKTSRLALSIAAALLAAATAVAAPPEGKGKPDKDKDKGGKQAKYSRSYDDRDVDWDEAAFRVFVGEQRYGGYDSLPPGIRKNLARGKPLPPGIAKRDLPPEMLRRLPYREGYEWRAVGSDVVLYSIATGVVDQVLRDVFLD